MSKRRKMIREKDSWCHQQTEIFPSTDLNTVATPTSDHSPTHGFERANAEKSDTEFCADVIILDDTANVADNSSFNYPLDDITQPLGNIEFLGNIDITDSTDLLGFPELGNFEDVDRMFRSCDSTFGNGTSEDNESAWFQMENTNEGLFSKKQINDQRNELNPHQRYTGKRNDEVRNDGFIYVKNLPNCVIRQPYETNCSQTLLSFPNEHHGEDSEPSIFKNVGSDKIHLSNVDQIKSEMGTEPVDFPQLQAKESSHDKPETSHAETGPSSNTPESLMISSVMDDTSLEAATLLHLQLVLEKLDVRMKLCIRDSLYRLAQSAEQRHHHANPSHLGGDNEANPSFLPEGPNSFINFEANTNSIDRSVAQLLFHRPSEQPSPVPRRKPSP